MSAAERGRRLKEFYEDYATTYETELVLRRAQLATVLTELPFWGRRGLDVGCDGGVLVSELLGAGAAQMVGCDLAESAVQGARHRLQRRGLASRGTFLSGDGQRLPFRDESFDFVCCFEVLEHLEHPEWAVLEMARVLRPQGVAAITVPNILSPAEALHTLKHWIMYWLRHEPITHLQYFTYWSVAQRLAPLGPYKIVGLHCAGGFLPLVGSQGPLGRLMNLVFRLDEAMGRCLPYVALDLFVLCRKGPREAAS